MTTSSPRVIGLLLRSTKSSITSPNSTRILTSSNRFNSTSSTSSSSNGKNPNSVPIGKLSQGLGFDSSSSRASGSNSFAGPFPMPDMASRDAQIRNEGRKWKQLKGSEKVGVVATQSWSLVVVLIGAAVAGAVIYSTGTELLSDNSPTR